MFKENLIAFLIKKRARISSSSNDEKGLQEMLTVLKSEFAILKPDTMEVVGHDIFHLTKRKKAMR
jgi:hypothetical protein